MSMFASICLYSKFVKILIGRIPGFITASVPEKKTVKKSWQINSTFVPCMYKFKSMQAINISYR